MFTLTIETDNAAFENNKRRETARILREIATRLDRGVGNEGNAMDVNGNTVGRWELTR